jgi:peptidoglycan hydrolase-like protein with peptidoglycan-binding domain
VTSAVFLALGGVALAQSQPGMSPSMSGSSQRVSADQVKLAQNQLKQQGLYDGPVDGIVGPQTKSAISQFQKKAGLRQTATLDQQTLSRLMGGGGSGSSAAPDTSGRSRAVPNQPGSSSAFPPSAPSMSAPAAPPAR